MGTSGRDTVAAMIALSRSMKIVLDNLFLSLLHRTQSRSREGRLPETAEGGVGCGARGRDLSSRAGGAWGLRRSGHYEPPARSSLTTGRFPAKARPGAGDARLRVSEDAAVKRRKARRPA